MKAEFNQSGIAANAGVKAMPRIADKNWRLLDRLLRKDWVQNKFEAAAGPMDDDSFKVAGLVVYFYPETFYKKGSVC